MYFQQKSLKIKIRIFSEYIVTEITLILENLVVKRMSFSTTYKFWVIFR